MPIITGTAIASDIRMPLEAQIAYVQAESDRMAAITRAARKAAAVLMKGGR